MPQRRILHWWFVHRYRRVNSFCPRDDTFLTFAYLARNRFPKKFGDWYKLVAAETLVTWIQMRASRGRSRRGRSPPPHETYKNNFIHDNFLQLEKQHPQHKAILPSIVLSQQCCEAFQAIMRLWLPNIIEIAPPPLNLLAGSGPACKFESSQREESRAQPVGPSKACSKPV